MLWSHKFRILEDPFVLTVVHLSKMQCLSGWTFEDWEDDDRIKSHYFLLSLCWCSLQLPILQTFRLRNFSLLLLTASWWNPFVYFLYTWVAPLCAFNKICVAKEKDPSLKKIILVDPTVMKFYCDKYEEQLHFWFLRFLGIPIL